VAKASLSEAQFQQFGEDAKVGFTNCQVLFFTSNILNVVSFYYRKK